MKRFRLVTYNIHKAIGGVDRRYRPERVIEVLRALEADLVFLQEVDEGVPRSRRDRQVDLLGDALGYKYRAYFPNVRLKRGHYGNALLSRMRLEHSENIDLTMPLKKRRGALHARLTVSARGHRRRIWLFNVHLGLAEYERRRQLQRVLAWQHHHHLRHDTAAIIGGDFNDVWGRLGPGILEPEGYECGRTKVRTFPAVRPLRALDRVFVRGPARIDRVHVSRTKVARAASDHLPVVAEIDL